MNRKEFVKYLGATSVLIATSSCVSSRIFGNKFDDEICENEWVKIANKGEAFKYVSPNKNLQNVLIYGDSISIGYTPTVRELLSEKANVFRIYKNGQSSDKFIPYMEKMKITMFQPSLEQGWGFEWDVIHFNVGLHDLKYVTNGKLDKKNGKQVSSLEEYKANLNKICTYLIKEYPKAKLIFATTTAVPYKGDDGRFTGDSVRYNQAAKEVLANYPSIIINDLYEFTIANAAKWYIAPENVHYSNIGKTAQGEHVAKVIAKKL